MLTDKERVSRARAFVDAEASLRLEEMDPTTDSRYLAIKADLIAGNLSFDEAEAALEAAFGKLPDTERELPASA